MALRTWAKLLGATLGAAALAAAGQLGVAYGLGILRFSRVVEVTQRDEWIAQLAWVAWFAMTAAAAGGLIGRTRLPRTAGPGARVVAAVAAGLGAAVTVPLTMQPARSAQVAGVDAVIVIGACAVLGAAAGIFVAYAALSRAVARWSLLTLGAAVWVVAAASVAPSLRPGAELPAVRLGVLEPSLLPAGVIDRTALFTMPALALIAGLILGLVARRRRLSTGDIALAGLPGPALLTLSYLVAGPGAGADRYQEVPYWAAMTAAGAGVFGSVLAAVLRRGPVSSTSPGAAATPDRPLLPRRDAQPDSAIAQAGANPTGSPAADPATGPSADPTGRPGGAAGNPAAQPGPGFLAQPATGHSSPPTAGFGSQPGTGFPAQSGAGSLGQSTAGFPAQPTAGYPSQPSAGFPAGAAAAGGGPLPGTGAAAAITGRAAVAARAKVAAQRSDHELRPSDTGVLALPPQDPPQSSRGRTQDHPDEFVDWVSGLGRK